MYFWKCWRDTRPFFIVFLMIAAAMMPAAAVVCVGTGLLEEFGTSAVLSTFALILRSGVNFTNFLQKWPKIQHSSPKVCSSR
jgi:hypothetical protein